jgi:hypothetical protein
MTLAPSTLAASAVEIRDDDGQLVATIYARGSGVEIVSEQGWSSEWGYQKHPSPVQHLAVNFTRAEERRR